MQKRNSILCPNCRKLISADEPMCPFCHVSRPGSKMKNNVLISGMANPKRVVLGIIWVNLGMYVLSLILSGNKIEFGMNPFGMLSPSGQSLLILGATGEIPINKFFRWWSPLSAMYLHGSVLHILFNMMMFWQIVPLVIKEYGTRRMLIIYTLGGIGGYIASYLTGTELTVGASGAIFALVGSLLYFGKSRGGQYGQALYSQLFGWVVIMAVFGLLVSRVDNWAHGAGLVAGAALGWALGYEERRREKLIHKTLGMICIIGTGGVLLWSIGSAIWIYIRYL